jgi:hypothetical protein
MSLIYIPRIIQNNSPSKEAHNLQFTNSLYTYSIIPILQPVYNQEKKTLKPWVYKIFKSKIMHHN